MGLGWLCWIEWIRPNSHTVQEYLERKYTNLTTHWQWHIERFLNSQFLYKKHDSLPGTHVPIHCGTQIELCNGLEQGETTIFSSWIYQSAPN